ncbi:hypothetical protein CDL15_Pgr021955 [Punica granatum]|uniref:Uncharacterized protein n=1 Tax=Punica granatum TaxID=22663 RepID=A0A218WDY8_PUNGR|nr:hypothetical protein CDL15_Pgr021955 [Punica granatum]
MLTSELCTIHSQQPLGLGKSFWSNQAKYTGLPSDVLVVTNASRHVLARYESFTGVFSSPSGAKDVHADLVQHPEPPLQPFQLKQPSRVCFFGFIFCPEFCRIIRVESDPRLFPENDQYSHLRRSIRVDLITLGVNDHHGHLEGSLGYPRPLTLPQNSTGCLRGDVRTDLCQSSLLSAPVGSVKAIWVCARPKQPKPDPTKV